MLSLAYSLSLKYLQDIYECVNTEQMTKCTVSKLHVKFYHMYSDDCKMNDIIFTLIQSKDDDMMIM